MKFYIVGQFKEEEWGMTVFNNNGGSLPCVGWTTDKEYATKFDFEEAKGLLNSLSKLLHFENLTLAPAETSWILRRIRDQTYLANLNCEDNNLEMAWTRNIFDALRFKSQLEATDHCSALKTIFHISTTAEELLVPLP